DKNDQLDVFISLRQYFTLFLIAACLLAPAQVGTAAYGLHSIVTEQGTALQKQLASIGGDPQLSMAEIQAAKDFAANGLKFCDTYPTLEQQTECREELGKTIADTEGSSNFSSDAIKNIANLIGDASLLALGPGGVAIKGAINAGAGDFTSAVGNFANTLGETAILTLLIPLLLLIGTSFLVILDIGQLTATVLLPFILLLALYDPGKVLQWGKSFMSWALISFSYKVIVTSVGFVMMQGNVAQTGLYAVLVGLFAPWAAYQVVSGSSLGIMNAASSIGRSIVGRI
ncbi:MAG: hypothetical protein ACRC62_19190, partial [Microcoleus sp.]